MTASATAPVAQPGRLDRALLDRARFPDTFSMPVRFADLDVLWHMNNAAAIVLLQEARVRFTRALALPKLPNGLRTMVGAMAVEYAAEVNYPGTVEISSGILRLGNTSYTFAQVIRQDERPCIYSLVTMVVSGPAGAHPIPDELRAALSDKGMIQA